MAGLPPHREGHWLRGWGWRPFRHPQTRPGLRMWSHLSPDRSRSSPGRVRWKWAGINLLQSGTPVTFHGPSTLGTPGDTLRPCPGPGAVLPSPPGQAACQGRAVLAARAPAEFKGLIDRRGAVPSIPTPRESLLPSLRENVGHTSPRQSYSKTPGFDLLHCTGREESSSAN